MPTSLWLVTPGGGSSGASVTTGTLAGRPAADGTQGLYAVTSGASSGNLYYDDAGSWVLVADATGAVDPAMGGDLTGTASNAQIAAGAVGPTELAATAVVAGSYGSASQVGTFTVDADGRLTAAGNATISAVDSPAGLILSRYQFK